MLDFFFPETTIFTDFSMHAAHEMHAVCASICSDVFQNLVYYSHSASLLVLHILKIFLCFFFEFSTLSLLLLLFVGLVIALFSQSNYIAHLIVIYGG